MNQTNTTHQSENQILIEYANLANATPMQIIEQNRTARITEIRHTYCLLRRDRHGATFAQIGKEINRTPETVQHAVIRIRILLKFKDERVTKLWNKVKDIPGNYR